MANSSRTNCVFKIVFLHCKKFYIFEIKFAESLFLGVLKEDLFYFQQIIFGNF